MFPASFIFIRAEKTKLYKNTHQEKHRSIQTTNHWYTDYGTHRFHKRICVDNLRDAIRLVTTKIHYNELCMASRLHSKYVWYRGCVILYGERVHQHELARYIPSQEHVWGRFVYLEWCITYVHNNGTILIVRVNKWVSSEWYTVEIELFQSVI